MRVIVAGDRRAGSIPTKPKPTEEQRLIYEAGKEFFINRILALRMDWKDRYGPITEVVSGMAKGIDTLGYELAKRITGKKAKEFPAKWSPPPLGNGKAGGIIRNEEMSQYSDGAIIIALHDPGGKSSIGSYDMAKRMRDKGLPYYLETWDIYELDLYIPGISELYHKERD